MGLQILLHDQAAQRVPNDYWVLGEAGGNLSDILRVVANRRPSVINTTLSFRPRDVSNGRRSSVESVMGTIRPWSFFSVPARAPQVPSDSIACLTSALSGKVGMS
jgi:hypothetical protein